MGEPWGALGGPRGSLGGLWGSLGDPWGAFGGAKGVPCGAQGAMTIIDGTWETTFQGSGGPGKYTKYTKYEVYEVAQGLTRHWAVDLANFYVSSHGRIIIVFSLVLLHNRILYQTGIF